MSTEPRNLTQLWCWTLIDELYRGGAREAVISPGLRSAPLAWACARLRSERADFRLWTIPDERSAAFFGLGLAKATGRPALLFCTSGTAGAHYYPALIEASVTGVPLIALTADRPPELHGFGANQSIDQTRLFGTLVPGFVALPVAEPRSELFASLRAAVAQAANDAFAGKRPIHLNVPLREPLMPVAPVNDAEWKPDWSTLSGGRAEGAPWLAFRPAAPVPPSDAISAFRERLQRAERPVLICGPRDPEPGDWELGQRLIAWSERHGIPVLSEVTSNLPRPLPHYEGVLREKHQAQSLRPDLAIRVGGRLTTRVLQAFADSAASCVRLHERGEVIDPSHRVDQVLEGGLSSWLEALSDLRPGARRYLEAWGSAHAPVRAVFEKLDAPNRALCEPAIARAVWASATEGSALVVGSSMPVRDLDAFSGHRLSPPSVFASRGVAGIDGGSSAAFGIAASGRKTTLLIGDTSFWHDLGGILWGARLGLSLTLVVVNNGGGRIFSFLDGGLQRAPGSEGAQRFDELLTMPLGLEDRLGSAARLAGGQYRCPSTVGELRRAMEEASTSGGVWLIDARVDGESTVEAHRALWAEAAPR